MTEVRDGEWAVGDAGTVTFWVRDDALVFEDVRANAGWSANVVRQLPHLLEVDLRSGTHEWEFSARYENGVLRVEIEEEVEPAGPGRYQVGDAGEVEIAVDHAGLKLVEVATAPGWRMRVDEETSKEIEIDFSAGAESWEFEAERNKRGEVEIEIEYEIEGRFAAEQ